MQGVTLGDIDKAANFLVESPTSAPDRVIDLGEFQEGLASEKGPRVDSLRFLSSRFDNFHPATHPILWRALVASACLAWVLAQLARDEASEPEALVADLFAAPRVGAKLDWRDDQRADAGAIDTPEGALLAAAAHLMARLGAADLLD